MTPGIARPNMAKVTHPICLPSSIFDHPIAKFRATICTVVYRFFSALHPTATAMWVGAAYYWVNTPGQTILVKMRCFA